MKFPYLYNRSFSLQKLIGLTSRRYSMGAQ